MKIQKPAVAGTLESSDAMVTVEPNEEGCGIEFELDSVVAHQYGVSIRKTVMETLERLDVRDAKVSVVDKGALDCTLKARVECAVYRSNDQTENLPWGGVIK
ncbi:MAG: citrate lyase acyl carrier protein [Dorea sp.]